jgi:hypothetical protein
MRPVTGGFSLMLDKFERKRKTLAERYIRQNNDIWVKICGKRP